LVFIVVISIAVVLVGASAGCGKSGAGTDGGRNDSGTVSETVDYLIVAADGLSASAARYRDFRKASGYHVDLTMVSEIVGDVADVATASARIQSYVRSRYDARDTNRPMFLLLLGDAQTVWPGDGSGVPTGTWTAPSPSTASDGAELTVTATFPSLTSGAEAIVTLESTRKAILGDIAAVPADGDSGRDAVVVKNYETANDKVVASVTASLTESSLSTTLKIPSDLPAGRYYIKVFAQDARSDFIGSTPLTVNEGSSMLPWQHGVEANPIPTARTGDSARCPYCQGRLFQPHGTLL
jgi:hypothetical protein